jgi:uncharacterized RDD family membrane protein YckC
MNILIHRNGQQFGPYSPDDLRSQVSAGVFSLDDLAWAEGMPEWRTIREVLPGNPVSAPNVPVAVAVVRPAAQPVNPYQAPQTAIQVAPESNSTRAGKGQRLLTYVIDYVAVILCSFVFGFVVVLAFGQSGADILTQIPDFVLGLILFMIYYIVMEASCSRTVGKLVTGTKVVTESGERPSFGQIVGRTFCRFIPFEALSFLGEGGQGWHDSISKTQVIKSR